MKELEWNNKVGGRLGFVTICESLRNCAKRKLWSASTNTNNTYLRSSRQSCAEGTRLS